MGRKIKSALIITGVMVTIFVLFIVISGYVLFKTDLIIDNSDKPAKVDVDTVEIVGKDESSTSKDDLTKDEQELSNENIYDYVTLGDRYVLDNGSGQLEYEVIEINNKNSTVILLNKEKDIEEIIRKEKLIKYEIDKKNK